MRTLPVLPEMKCDKGCGECCGPALCSEREYQTVKRYAKRHGVKPIVQGLTCPFYQDGECKVYEVRPRICRLFGHSDRLVCCKGYNTNVSKKAESEFMAGYHPERVLHELAGQQGIKAMYDGHQVRGTVPLRLLPTEL